MVQTETSTSAIDARRRREVASAHEVTGIPLPSSAVRRPVRRWNDYYLELVAREISAISRYCADVVQFRPLGVDSGHLLERIERAHKRVGGGDGLTSDLSVEPGVRRLLVLNGNLNHTPDVQAFLAELRTEVGRHDRIAAVLYDPYLHWVYRLGNRVGLRRGELPRTFLT